MKEIAKKEVSEIMEVDTSRPQCLSAHSQGHYLCQLNTFTIPFKLLSKLIISEPTHLFPILPWGSFSVIQRNPLEPSLDTRPLVLHKCPKCGTETKKHCRSPISQQIEMRLQRKQEPHSRAAHVNEPMSCCEPSWVRLREFAVTSEGQATHGFLESSLCPQLFLFQDEKPSCTLAFLSSD